MHKGHSGRASENFNLVFSKGKVRMAKAAFFIRFKRNLKCTTETEMTN